MKKNKWTLFAILALVPCLTSCLFVNNNRNNTGNGTLAYYQEPSSYPRGYDKENLNVSNLGYWNDQIFMPSTGESSILVVPIEFSDDAFTATELERISYSFFGESEDTGWESVASYYEKSSYGKLNIVGDVTEPVHFDISTHEAQIRYEKDNSFVQTILFSALDGLEKNGLDFSRYDANGDGILDAVWLVYSAPFSSTSDFYWAFTTWAMEERTYGGYMPSSYSWASVDFLQRGRYRPYFSSLNGDAHTFIHETGHLMGLDDYYSYDNGSDGNQDSPTGGTMMMDYNIGDHDAYSKFVLDWIEPTVITKSYLEENDYTITLESFGQSGDALILPISKDGTEDYNGTPFDEYLILEYYTPDGLNQQDAETAYESLSMFGEPGLLVYHVNSRIGKMVADRSAERGVSWDGYCYDAISNALEDQSLNYLFYYLYSNTRSYSLEKSITTDEENYYRGRLLSLLSADERKTYFSTPFTMANDSSLFQEGDAFLVPGGSFEEFTFDDGSLPQFGFTVQESGDTSCVLHFEEVQ